MRSSVPPAFRGRPLVGLPLAWAAVVLVLTLTPSRNMPRVPHWELLSFDTAAHAGVFVLLAALTVFSMRRQHRWAGLGRGAYLAAATGCVGFGLLIEALQSAIRVGRQGEWSDALSDTIGVGGGLLLAYTTRRWWQTPGGV